MTRAAQKPGRGLRDWLEYVAATAIEMLDELDAAATDLEDDELGNDDAQPRAMGARQ